MKRPEYPTLRQCELFAQTRLEVLGITASILCESDDDPLFDAISREASDAHNSAKGNKGGGMMPVSWSDLKFMLAGTLRVCLDHLERDE